jgi:hypothetical protein
VTLVSAKDLQKICVSPWVIEFGRDGAGTRRLKTPFSPTTPTKIRDGPIDIVSKTFPAGSKKVTRPWPKSLTTSVSPIKEIALI